MRLLNEQSGQLLNIKSPATLKAIIHNLKAIERLESGKVAYTLNGYRFRLIGSIKTLLELRRIEAKNETRKGTFKNEKIIDM